MYIVTTSKRIHQITALVFVCLALAAGFSISRYYTAYHAQPDGLVSKVLTDAGSAQGVSLADIDAEALMEEAKLVIFEQLQAQLLDAGVPNAEQSAEQLLPQATAFLSNEGQFMAWLTRQIQLMSPLSANWVPMKDSLTLQRWQASDGCLVIERHDQQWQLVSILSC